MDIAFTPALEALTDKYAAYCGITKHLANPHEHAFYTPDWSTKWPTSWERKQFHWEYLKNQLTVSPLVRYGVFMTFYPHDNPS